MPPAIAAAAAAVTPSSKKALGKTAVLRPAEAAPARTPAASAKAADAVRKHAGAPAGGAALSRAERASAAAVVPKKLGAPAAGRVHKSSTTAAPAPAAAPVVVAADVVVRPHRWRQGRRAYLDIRRFRGLENKMLPSHTRLLLRKLPFERLVREIAQDQAAARGAPTDQRFSKLALEALQVAAEDFINDELEAAQKLALYAGHISVTGDDLRMAVHHTAPQLSYDPPACLGKNTYTSLVSVSKPKREAAAAIDDDDDGDDDDE
jgi:histone H3/H4